MQIEYTTEEGKLIETKTETKQEVVVYNYEELVAERKTLLSEIERIDGLLAKCLELGVEQDIKEDGQL